MAKAGKKSTTARPKSALRIPPELAEQFRVQIPPELVEQFRVQIPPELAEQFRQSQERAVAHEKARKRIDQALAYQNWGIVPPWLTPQPQTITPDANPKRKSRSSPQFNLARQLILKLYPDGVPDTETTQAIHDAIAVECEKAKPKRLAPSWKVVDRALGRSPR